MLVDDGRWRRHPPPPDDRRHAGAREHDGCPECSIAFEGLDQSGKQTQAERLRDRLERRAAATCRLLSFPDYDTPIGAEIARALHGERDYGADVMQLLYVANRYERKRDDRSAGSTAALIVVCDRYLASSVAYGEAQGSTRAWLVDIQRFLPQPDLTILLDIAPETAVQRKAAGPRSLRARPRAAGARPRQLPPPGGDGRLDRGSTASGRKDDVAADVVSAVATRLALP